MTAIIADTPFLSSNSGLALVGLPDQLRGVGLSTLQDLWTAPPATVVEAITGTEIRIENGARAKQMPRTVGELDPRVPHRLMELLRTRPRGLDGRARISELTLAQLLN